jgi:RNA polymerase sigma factor (sigma-70 family)
MEQDPPVGLSVEHEDILECWLQKLPTKHAEACRLLFLAGKTQVEAARILGFSQSRLSSLRREALSMLKDASSSNSDDAA